MAVEVLVGWVLVAGLVLFLVGAAGWRPAAYDVPLAEALPAIHRDRRRWVWIHVWMIVAMLVTPAGLVGLALVTTQATARSLVVLAAAVYALGAVCWILALTFRLTVVPWAAEVAVAAGAAPDGVPAFDRWAGALYAVHMASAYLVAAVLGSSVLVGGELPRWLGWLGVVWGPLFLVGFVSRRLSGLFEPPFWAHVYGGVVGVVLLTT